MDKERKEIETEYNPKDDFFARIDSMDIPYEIDKQRIVNCNDGEDRLLVSIKAEHNKDGFAILGMCQHFKNPNHNGEQRLATYNYMMIEPRRISVYWDIDENNDPIKTRGNDD